MNIAGDVTVESPCKHIISSIISSSIIIVCVLIIIISSSGSSSSSMKTNKVNETYKKKITKEERKE